MKRLLLPALLTALLAAARIIRRHQWWSVALRVYLPRLPIIAAAFYTVKKGDTLYSIALDNGQSYRDVAAWNNIENPNMIRVGQSLRVAPPVRSRKKMSVLA